MTAQRSIGLSLRIQVALVIAVLSLLPNVVMAMAVLLPVARDLGGLGRTTLLSLGIWSLAVIVLSAGIGYLVSRWLLAPLSRLTGEIAELPATARRLSNARLGIDPADPGEVLELRGAFNRLLERVHVEQERRASFMATLMHDLKTPLIASRHLLEAVREDETITREERIDLVTRLATEHDALIALVQKMVDAHKFEREDARLSPSDVALDDLVGAVADRVRPLAEERGVAVATRGSARAHVDPKEFERALYNLVSNAVRYARSAIAIEVFPGMVRIADDGPGLPAPLERLAQPFNAQPVEIAGKRYTAGTGGLGLFIARRIIEAHGGRLVAEATGAGGTVLLVYTGRRYEASALAQDAAVP